MRNKIIEAKLRKQAQSLGLQFHPMTGEKKLKMLIEKSGNKPYTLSQNSPTVPEVKVADKQAQVLPEESKIQRMSRLREEQLSMVKVVVRCNNDNKSDWKGQTIKVSNNVVGSFTKFIPFDNEDGWHIPAIMLNTLKDKMCQKFKSIKLASGIDTKQSYMVKEFTIETLPPNTQKEWDDLAAEQAARGAID